MLKTTIKATLHRKRKSLVTPPPSQGAQASPKANQYSSYGFISYRGRESSRPKTRPQGQGLTRVLRPHIKSSD